MKTSQITTALLVSITTGIATAQMPTNTQPAQATGGGAPLPTGFDASGSSVKPQQQDPAHQGETPNPQLLGMELPLLDPSTDTVKYNGGMFDVGNNAAVRARFEKYLQQVPDDSSESKRYRAIIKDILKQTQRAGRDQRYAVGNEVLIHVGKALYQADKYPGDGGQSGTLASSIVSALDSQRQRLQRLRENKELEHDMQELIREADRWQNSSVHRKTAISAGANNSPQKGGGAVDNGGDTNTLRIAHHVKSAAKLEAAQASNTAANEAAAVAAKINYQSVLVTMLMSRRFDHVVIGARVYRHIFREGDTKLDLNEDSKAFELFSGGMGLPPTINTLDTLASNARRDVDQAIQSVHGMLARNKLGEATQGLIQAVAIGEFMQSVATFPTEARQRIARYWTLRKRALTALNARDYATVEDVAAKMKEMDVDFDDSLLLTFTTGKKRQSDLAIRNARKALQAGDEEKFNQYIQEAGTIWPRNPNLDKGVEMIAKYDEGDSVKEEFRNLYKGGEFRKIARDRERFKIVAIDPSLAKQYEEAITLVMKMDGMLQQIKTVADQDATMGPCMAYEKILEWQKEDPRYAEDKEMVLAQKDFESRAHDFVQALRDAENSEKRSEYGSALSCYYRAQCIYPHSAQAAAGIKRVMSIIVQATYE